MARGGGGARGRRHLRRQVKRTDQVPVETPLELPDREESDRSSDSQDDASSDDDAGDAPPPGQSYSALLQAFGPATAGSENGHRRKRRKIEATVDNIANGENIEDAESALSDEENDEATGNGSAIQNDMDSDDDDQDRSNPYSAHFDRPDADLKSKITKALAGDWQRDTKLLHRLNTTALILDPATASHFAKSPDIHTLGIKARLQNAATKLFTELDGGEQYTINRMLQYQDIVSGARTVENASKFRKATALHALNHIFKGRDRVLKNSEKLVRNPDTDQEYRDQGFTRPKVLVLLETRQACYRFLDDLTTLSGAAQQENKKRFQDSFSSEDQVRDDMPDDYKELYDGNRDDNFKIAVKLTRKTVKYFSAFYGADIIVASPLGLRGVIENSDPKKSDHDFLSSIEIVIVDQADAMLMQNWDHVEFVFSHLNLQPREAHGCDFSRVRTWYLDAQAKYLRQTIVLSGYLTPDLNRLFNSTANVDGRLKVVPSYDGAILASSGLGIRQTFSRYNASTPAADPDERFAYFTSAIVPGLERIATSSSSDSPAGILLYVPSYLDFVRVRNFLRTSPATQNVASGSLSEYDAVSDARRARSHFLSGRHAVLLYSERAHHFNRYRIRGVKRVVFYAPPENPKFFEEVVAGYLGTSMGEGVEAKDMNVRVVFSKFDGLRLERIVGSGRVKDMLVGKTGDTFDFV